MCAVAARLLVVMHVVFVSSSVCVCVCVCLCVYVCLCEYTGGAVAVVAENSGFLSASDCSFTGNVASSAGGGIFVGSGDGVGISSCVFEVNLVLGILLSDRVIVSGGGAIAARNPSPDSYVMDSRFTRNNAKYSVNCNSASGAPSYGGVGLGGAIYWAPAVGGSRIDGCTFERGHACTGGAVASMDATFEVSNVVAADGEALSGGVFAFARVAATITNVTALRNQGLGVDEYYGGSSWYVAGVLVPSTARLTAMALQFHS